MQINAIPAGSLGANSPMQIAFTPDGTKLYTGFEQGFVFIRDTTIGSNRLFYNFTGFVPNDSAAIVYALAVHPDFNENPYVYVYFASGKDANALKTSRIVRLRDTKGSVVEPPYTVWTSNAEFQFFDIGAMTISPKSALGERFLFVGTSYGLYDPSLSQDLTSRMGKILRLKLNGSFPLDNQFPNGIFAYGVRNTHGLVFDYQTAGKLWESEKGGFCNSEINTVDRGNNFAFGPKATCSTGDLANPQNTNQDGISPKIPVWFMNTRGVEVPPPQIGAMVFCDHCGLRGAGGRLFATITSPTYEIRVFELSAARNKIVSASRALAHNYPIHAMTNNPTGRIFFADAVGDLYYLINLA